MKPSDLKRTTTFATRRPLVQDGVFYVPTYYKEYGSFQLPPFTELFQTKDPTVYIEYCSGNGDWVVQRAMLYPDKQWVAVEQRFDRVRKIWSKMRNASLSNLLIVCGEAATFTKHYLQRGDIEGIFINFPDPWPKGRHAKNRLLRPLFLTELARILQKGKKVTVVSDDLVYVSEIIEHFTHHKSFSPCFPPPYYLHTLAEYGSSWFEELWRVQGKDIHYMEFLHTWEEGHE